MVEVEEHAGIGVGIVTGEGNAAGVGSTGAGDRELHTTNVGLHAVEDIGTMKGNELSAKQVVSRCDVRGKLHIHTTSVSQQSVHSPLTIGRGITIFIDLEPHVSSASVRLGKVHDDGAKV